MKNLEYSKMYDLVHELSDNFDIDERREIIEHIDDGDIDFEVGDYRFISSNDIDEIMRDDLLSDLYCLGACSDWFIADITGLSTETVNKLQKADGYEALGELMAQKIDEVVDGIVSSDGYGPHFAHYDGYENELSGADYYYFKVN